MDDYQQVRAELGAGALQLKYVMLAMGLVPVLFLAVEIALKKALPAQSLAQMRDALPLVPIIIAFAAASFAAVTIAPRLVYNSFVRRRTSSSGDQPGQGSGILIVLLALAVTPSDLGLALFFLSNILVTLPFHVLSLFYVWRFNLNIGQFLDGMARDLTGEGGASRQ